MDGLEDILGSLFGDDSNSNIGFDSDAHTDLNDVDLPISDVDLRNMGNDFPVHYNPEFTGAMNEALSSFQENFDSSNSENIDIINNFHHEPFSGEPDYNTNNEITFEGNGDKYTDNEHNQKLADQWIAEAEKRYQKGDKSGGDRAIDKAEGFLKRIKK